MESLITIVVAIIGVLPPLLAWGRDLALSGKQRSKLNELKLRIDLLEAWIRTRQSFAGSEEDINQLSKGKQELDKLFNQYHDVLKRERSLASAGFVEIGWFRRAFLIYPAGSNKERLLHVAFYTILVFLSFFILGISIPESGKNPSLQYLSENPSLLVGIVPFAIILLLLQKSVEDIRAKNKE